MRPEVYHLGLIGYPLTYSLSPSLHHAALQAAGLVGEYHIYPVPPLPQGQKVLLALLSQMRQGELHGLNVTIPHKQAIIPFLDHLTPEAHRIGAVNTLINQNGHITGDNTDAAGFWKHLSSLAIVREANQAALILGAGGAARAVACALLQAGWPILIAARRLEQAQGLAQDLTQSFPPTSIQEVIALPLDRDALEEHLAQMRLIINATPLGMSPYIERSPWPSGLNFPNGAAIYDLVYHPPQTRLIREARQAGLQAFNGLGMLIEQAALAFERWTGLPALREPMYQAIAPETT